MKPLFSFFEKGIKHVTPTKNIFLEDFVKIVREEKYRSLIDGIREIKDKKERQKAKEKLPYVTFAGTFEKRGNGYLKESSGYACFDIDDIKVKEVREKLIRNKYTHLTFTSPSGNGLKLVVKIPKVKTDEEYKKYWLSIAQHYNISDNDVATKDISRACYLSIDSDLYFNSDSEVYSEKGGQMSTINKGNDIIKTKPQLQDLSRSGLEYRKILALLRQGKSRAEIYDEMMAYSKWSSANESYRTLTFEKAEDYYLQNQKEKPIEHEGDLNIKTLLDYKKLKKDKSFIVDGFLYPKTTNMLYSPPAEFKSILAEDLGMSIASGKTFLDMDVKKQPVLYCDGENSDTIIKERLIKLKKGKKINRWKIPFYVLKTGILIDEKKQVHLGFLTGLEKAIEQYKIKVLIFDTLHRFAFYDENRADDINILYTKVFKPLIEDYGITIIFLHHSTKQGNYRGSGDFLGMVDVSYKVCRAGKTNKFFIVNEKCRSGEIPNLSGEVDFGEEYIKIIRIDEEEEQEEKINVLKELTNKVESLFEIGNELTKKDIETQLEIEEFDFSQATLKRVLKYLIEKSKLDNFKKGIYRRIK